MCTDISAQLSLWTTGSVWISFGQHVATLCGVSHVFPVSFFVFGLRKQF